MVLLLLMMMTMMMLFSLQLLLPKSEERGSDDAHMDLLSFPKETVKKVWFYDMYCSINSKISMVWSSIRTHFYAFSIICAFFCA